MCTTCGCGQGETRIEDAHDHEHVHADGTVHSHLHDHADEHGHGHDHAHAHQHRHADGTVHSHPHDHADEHGHGHGHGHHDHRHEDLHYGLGPAGAHAPGMSQARMVQIEQDILGKNDALAAANRKRFAERGIFAVNLVSSPGSGKTTLLVKTIEALKGRHEIVVIEGDQADELRRRPHPRDRSAARCRSTPGKGCHLDADMVGQSDRAARAAGGSGADDRERRQPRLPGRLRPRRGAQGRRALGHRGRRQAAQVSGHVPRARA